MFDFAEYCDCEANPKNLCTRGWSYWDFFATQRHGRFINDPEKIINKVDAKSRNKQAKKPNSKENFQIVQASFDAAAKGSKQNYPQKKVFVPTGFCYAMHGNKRSCAKARSCSWKHFCWKCDTHGQKKYHSAASCHVAPQNYY